MRQKIRRELRKKRSSMKLRPSYIRQKMSRR